MRLLAFAFLLLAPASALAGICDRQPLDHGDAWIERCGMDKIVVLVARYYTKPMMEASCGLGSDGDNYNRATCHMRQSGRDWKGLEAWFQRHE